MGHDVGVVVLGVAVVGHVGGIDVVMVIGFHESGGGLSDRWSIVSLDEVGVDFDLHGFVLVDIHVVIVFLSTVQKGSC